MAPSGQVPGSPGIWAVKTERSGAAKTPAPLMTIRPIFALLPILVVAQVKAAGFVSIAGVDTTLLSLALLVGISAVKFLRDPWYPARKMLPYLLVSVVVVLGMARSDPGEYQSSKAQEFLVTSVVVACIPVLLRDVRDLRGLLGVWFWGGTLVAALVLIVGGSEGLWGRAGIGEATLGPAYLSAAVLVVGSAGLGERILPFAVAIPGIVLGGVALVTIGSRGPIVGAACGILTWVLLRGLGVLGRRTIMALMAVGVAALVGLSRASDTALSRFSFEDSARAELWATARNAFLDSPIIGLGWGDFSTVSVLAWTQKYPHNIFLEVAAELGVLGVLSLMALLVIASLRVWKNRSPEVRVLAAVAAVMLVGQQFSTDLTNRMFWIALVPCLLLPVRLRTAPGPLFYEGRIPSAPAKPSSLGGGGSA